MPLMMRSLKLSDRAVTIAVFVTAFLTFFFVALAERVLPRGWPGHPGSLPLAAGLLISGSIFLFAILPWSRSRMGRRMDQLLPPMLTRLAADAEGVTISDELSHGHWSWAHIRGAFTTPDGVVILMGYGGMFVPTTAFRDKDEQAAFVALVDGRANKSAM